MWYTNGLRHVFLGYELDLVVTSAIVNQTTVKTVIIVRSTELNTNVADEQLYQQVNYSQHYTHNCVDALWEII